MCKQLAPIHRPSILDGLVPALAIVLIAGACGQGTTSSIPSVTPSASEGGSTPADSTPTPTASSQDTTGDTIQTTIPAEASMDPAEDPFIVGPSEECDPRRDTENPEEYTPLETLDRQELGDLPVIPEVVNVALAYTNDKLQKFAIVVSGANDAVIEAYIAETGVCLEALPIAVSPIVQEPVRLDEILVDAAVAITKQAQAALAANRDALVAGGNAGSLAEVLTNLGAEPGEVLGMAMDSANTALEAAVTDGRISQEMAQEGADLLDQLLNQPGAPFLFDPADEPDSDEKWTEVIRGNPENAVVVTFRSQDPAPSEPALEVVWFAVDPPIDEGEYDYYRAKCSTWASARIAASAGSARLRFWRYSPYDSIGTQSDSAGAPSPGWLSDDSDKKVTWDVGVTGLKDKSDYSIYGGWVQGTGGFC
jgi:hypothetical protein